MPTELWFTLYLVWSNGVHLTKQQTQTITQTVTRLAETGTAVYLFGSRLNPYLTHTINIHLKTISYTLKIFVWYYTLKNSV